MRAAILAMLAVTACGGGASGPCSPGVRECRDGDVWACRADGTGFDRVVTCPVATSTCIDGSCQPLGFRDALDEPSVDVPADGRPDTTPDAPAPHDQSASPDASVDPGAPDPGPPDSGAPDPGGSDPGGSDPGGPDPGGPERLDVPADPDPDVAADAGPELAAEPAPEPAPDVTEPAPEPPVEVVDEPVSPGCGDGIVQAPGEACEPGKPLGTTCAQVGYAGGTLACHPDCTFDTSGCDAKGALGYERLVNLTFLDDFVDVAWRADGVEAWFVRQNGGLVGYDPATKLLSAVTLPAGFVVRRIVPLPFEAAVLLAGAVTAPSTSARLFRYDPADGSFTELEAFRLDGFEWIAGAFAPDGKQFVAGGTKPSSGSQPGNVLRWSAVPFGGDTLQQTWLSWPGLSDLTWGTGDEYAGTAFVLTSEGWNGGGSHDWVIASNTLIQNTWGGFGNAGRGGWRPGGRSAVFAATSTTNALYVDDNGTWTKQSFPQPYFSVASIAWNATGSRMLAVGRAGGGSNLVGSVYEYRPSGAAFLPGSWVNQTIPDFDEAPWLAVSNTTFHHAAFRPHSDCAEGLIAASDNGVSYAPTFGLALRFHDTADPACE